MMSSVAQDAKNPLDCVGLRHNANRHGFSMAAGVATKPRLGGEHAAYMLEPLGLPRFRQSWKAAGGQFMQLWSALLESA